MKARLSRIAAEEALAAHCAQGNEMTREKIIGYILSTIMGQTGISTIPRIALDAMQPPVAQPMQFMCELGWDIGCLVYPWGDGGYLLTPDTTFPDSFGRFCLAREEWEKSQRGEKKPCATVLSDGK
jgi:hypothetical protein